MFPQELCRYGREDFSRLSTPYTGEVLMSHLNFLRSQCKLYYPNLYIRHKTLFLQVHLCKSGVFCLNFAAVVVYHWANFNLIVHHTKYFPTKYKFSYHSYGVCTTTNTSCKVTNNIVKQSYIIIKLLFRS